MERHEMVNDIHTRLNPTRVGRVEAPATLDGLRAAVASASASGDPISIAGGCHAMGGQQFVTDGVVIDTRRLDRVLGFDASAGIVEVEAGIQWPALIDRLVAMQQGNERQWAIAQKQTGADRLTIGGSLSANVHGRGLAMKPFIADVESFTILDAGGSLRTCSRSENRELFRLAIGGYGLFGIVCAVRLRLRPRHKLRRVVEMTTIEKAMALFQQRIDAGFQYGDFQFDINQQADGFLSRGVLACYQPVDPATPLRAAQRELSEADWLNLFALAHTDKQRAFDLYTSHYRSTDGQIYWSDIGQLSYYPDNYHVALDRQLGSAHPASEVITEIYVARSELAAFMGEVAEDFRGDGTDLIYGTVRLIEPDDESFLAWAKQPYACIVFNLHVVHTPADQVRAGAAFRKLIDRGLAHGGSYFLTYHRHATRLQVEACYPQMPEFLRLKRAYDPNEAFQSDWYRHYRSMFADRLREPSR
ncbi:MAG: FAD-binding oxidoreductase, partial [Bauldia sp.]